MTGYDSKRQMTANKLWDRPSVAFDEWWNGDNDESTNPFRLDSGAYWAWAGWKAALAQPAQDLRWYCIDKTGMATLCADEDDAKQNAKLAEQDWPRNAPYKAVQLCEYAPPAAQPAQEPVAWDNCRSEKQCRSWCGNSACGSHWQDAASPQREWVGLTEDEMLAVVHYSQLDNARAIKAKLKERNHGA